MMNEANLARLKRGCLLINCARGGVIDERALLAALESGQVGGAGLDVFAEEPPRDFALLRHPRVVATPHIGAQTREAQERIAVEIARMVLQALEGSLAVAAVNLPFRPAGSRVEPYLRLGEQLGRLASAMIDARLQELRVDLWGIEEALQAPVAVAVLKGALTPFLGEAVNFVNAETLATSRGLEVVRSTHGETIDFAHLVGVTARGEGHQIEVAGTIYNERDPRVVRFAGYQLEFRPQGRLLVLRNRDVPGVVGVLGTLLGEAGINIADIHLARGDGSTDAMAVLRLDQEPDASLLAKLDALEAVRSTRVVDLG
jgi:D-3-phosphoglycerate dehydrogenase